jgi:hypothetical protein
MKPQAPQPPPAESGVGEAPGLSIAGAQPFNKRPLVVVLPFLDLPSEGQDRSLGLGLAEELIQALGRVPISALPRGLRLWRCAGPNVCRAKSP